MSPHRRHIVLKVSCAAGFLFTMTGDSRASSQRLQSAKQMADVEEDFLRSFANIPLSPPEKRDVCDRCKYDSFFYYFCLLVTLSHDCAFVILTFLAFKTIGNLNVWTALVLLYVLVRPRDFVFSFLPSGDPDQCVYVPTFQTSTFKCLRQFTFYSTPARFGLS